MTRARARRTALAGAAFLALVVQLDQRERAMLEAWLTCIDCRTELDSVRAVAQRKPEAVVDSLGRALLEGPGVARLRAADSVLAIGFVRDSTYRLRHGLPPGPVPSDSFVTQGRRRLEHGYRVRAAIALGWIHDARAVATLNQALLVNLAPNVRRAVLYARDSLP